MKPRIPPVTSRVIASGDEASWKTTPVKGGEATPKYIVSTEKLTDAGTTETATTSEEKTTEAYVELEVTAQG